MTEDSLVAKGTGRSLFDALLTKEVVAAWGFDCIFKDIKADRAQPSIIRKTRC